MTAGVEGRCLSPTVPENQALCPSWRAAAGPLGPGLCGGACPLGAQASVRRGGGAAPSGSSSADRTAKQAMHLDHAGVTWGWEGLHRDGGRWWLLSKLAG